MKKFLHCIIASAVVFNLQQAVAQDHKCGSDVPSQQWEAQLQQLIEQQKIAQAANKSAASATLYTIPVIMHVLHGGQPVGTYPNLAQGQLNSQIQVLNDDYAGSGFNNSTYPANAFTTWATNQSLPAANLDGLGRVKIANCNIQFCLVTKDSLGNILPEPGIDRVNYVSKGWSDPASIGSYAAFKAFIDGTVKPGTIWNCSKYLNIWITDANLTATGGLLGYATFPPFSTLSGLSSGGTATTDGFWCYTKVFGSINLFPAGVYYNTSYNKGRTCTHEIGHWLGLRHIWGDGTCATDFCNDTPPAAASNGGTPAYPYHVGTCSTNTPDGEMYMNFMDYTSHQAMYMFSPDQANRMQIAMANSPYRKFLGTHGFCSVTNAVATASFNTATTLCANTNLTFTNSSTGSPTPTYTWSTSGSTTISPNIYTPNPTIYFPSPGTYTITLTASNGSPSVMTKTVNVIAGPNVNVTSPTSVSICTGQSATFTATGATSYVWSGGGGNSSTVSVSPLSLTVYSVTGTTGSCSIVKTVTVDVNFLPTVTASANISSMCAGDVVILTGGGANTYTWQPINVMGTTVNHTTTASQTFTCTGTDANGCEATAMVSIVVDPCTGIAENKVSAFTFNAYPNPAKDKLNLVVNTSKQIDLTIELVDAVGKVILKQNTSFDKVKTEQQINMTSVAPGIYFVKLSTKDGSFQTLKLVKD